MTDTTASTFTGLTATIEPLPGSSFHRIAYSDGDYSAERFPTEVHAENGLILYGWRETTTPGTYGNHDHQVARPDQYGPVFPDAPAIIENPYQDDPYSIQGRYIHDTGNTDEPHTGSSYYSGRYAAYYDGWWQGNAPTYTDAARLLFPAMSHGYNLSYYPETDDTEYRELIGIEVCADHARELWLSDPSQQFHVESDDGDRRYSSTAYCDECNEVISPQLCPHCGDELTKVGPKWIVEGPSATFTGNHTLPLFLHNHGYQVHADCLAELIQKGEATKTGKRTYTITDPNWFRGEYQS